MICSVTSGEERFEAIVDGTNQSPYRRIKAVKCLRYNMQIKSFKNIHKYNEAVDIILSNCNQNKCIIGQKIT